MHINLSICLLSVRAYLYYGWIQILFSAKSIQAHSHLKNELVVLKNDVESYETWGVDNDFSAADVEVKERVQNALKRLTNLCVYTLGKEDKENPNVENQTLFRNIMLHKIVLRALNIKEPNSRNGQESSHLIAIKRLALRFMSRFVLNNKQNQQLVFQEAFEQIIDSLNSPDYINEAIIVVDATFERNEFLANTVQFELLEKFASIIDNAHKQGHTFPKILHLFEKLAIVNKKPIRRNQELILSVLLQPKFEDRVMVIYEEPQQPGNREPQQHAMRALRHMQFLRSEEPKTQQFVAYHYALMRLLSQLCAGKSGNTEVRIQNIILPEHICGVVMSPGSTVKERMIFSELLFHLFLEAETQAKVILKV